MSTVSDRIIEKVRKLFSLAQSSNEHEAKSAADMANRLLIEHNLSAAEVESKKDYTELSVAEAKSLQYRQRQILGILNDFFFVEVYIQRDRYRRNPYTGRRTSNSSFVVVGTPVNAQIAQFVFQFLDRKYVELWEAYQKATGCSNDTKRSYMVGLSIGLRHQMETTRSKVQEERGLVIVPDNALKQYIKDKGCQSGAKPSRPDLDPGAVRDGEKEGRSLRIAQGIESTNQNKSAILSLKA